jgi:DNA-binding beta-propeller fold protein YncE
VNAATRPTIGGLAPPALRFSRWWRTLALTAGCLCQAALVAAQVTPAYLYTLSNFSGPLRYDWVRLAVDTDHGETYVIYQNVVRVFGANGMEVFSFGDDLDLGQIVDATFEANGDILLLSFKNGRSHVTRCNYRGVPIGELAISGLPAGVPFRANRMVRLPDAFYFVSLADAAITVTDPAGAFVRRIDLMQAVDADDRQKNGAEVTGVTVDRAGNVFFTVPTLFKVYKIAPDGTVTSFGRPGSGAGRFGVIAGIATDSQGNVLVADKLKCVVMVFDKDFNFLTEFGYRGARPENLIVPDDITVDAKDRVYVSQGRRRGISVFALAGG